MLLILEEYFKSYPIKKKIVEGMYSHGISLIGGKFYLGKIELSITEIANAFEVNRRTVYETIKLIERKEEIRKVLSTIKPSTDISSMAPLMGNQVVVLHTSTGYFSKVLGDFIDIVGKYGCYAREIVGKNLGKGDTFIRAIFYSSIPARIFGELENIEGVDRIVMTNPEKDSEILVCDKCEVKICPNKLSTELSGSEYLEPD